MPRRGRIPWQLGTLRQRWGAVGDVRSFEFFLFLKRIHEATGFTCTDTLRYRYIQREMGSKFTKCNILQNRKQPLAFREWLHVICCQLCKRNTLRCFLLRFIVNVLLDFLALNLWFRRKSCLERRSFGAKDERLETKS